MYTIPNDKRHFLKAKIINGAREYKKYLIDKDFQIICEDGTSHIVRFFTFNRHSDGFIGR